MPETIPYASSGGSLSEARRFGHISIRQTSQLIEPRTTLFVTFLRIVHKELEIVRHLHHFPDVLCSQTDLLFDLVRLYRAICLV